MSETMPKHDGDLVRLLLGCLLYRLGGEESFTMEEIDSIKETVGGVVVLLTPDNRIIARVKSPASYQALDTYLNTQKPEEPGT